MALVLVGSFAARVDHIALSLPYSRHVDEGTWVEISYRMLQTGNANPRRFNYPSLPVYLMTAGFASGLWGAELVGSAHGAKDLGRDVDDYYRLPGAALPPKLLFSLASVVALAAAGFVGFAITRRPALLWLTPLTAAISDFYFSRSWLYMNVDILGAGFAWTTLAYLFHVHTRGHSFAQGPGALRRLVTLGALCGLAVGCKYNLFPVLLPGSLWFVFFDRSRWAWHVVLLGVVAVTTFFLTTPYALVTPREFVTALAREMHHYANGHLSRAAISPGLPMLWQHVWHLAESFGWVPYVVSIAGAVLLFAHDARLAAVLLVWPVGFVGYMSLQRVFFERNDLALHPLVALTLSLALIELPSRAAAAVTLRTRRLTSRAASNALTVALTLVVLAGVPWPAVALAYSREIEPRNDVVRWLTGQRRPSGSVVIDAELGIDSRDLRHQIPLKVLDPKRDAKELASLLETEPQATIVTTSERRGRFERVTHELRELARFTRAEKPNFTVVILER